MGKTLLRWMGGQAFVGTDSNGHSIVIGRSREDPPSWIGVKPSELLLMAVASCAAFDVVEILEKQREPVRDFQVETSGDQLADPPYSFTKIHNHYILYGDVNPGKLEKAIKLSEDKYCSVISSLRPQVSISSDFEIYP